MRLEARRNQNVGLIHQWKPIWPILHISNIFSLVKIMTISSGTVNWELSLFAFKVPQEIHIAINIKIAKQTMNWQQGERKRGRDQKYHTHIFISKHISAFSSWYLEPKKTSNNKDSSFIFVWYLVIKSAGVKNLLFFFQCEKNKIGYKYKPTQKKICRSFYFKALSSMKILIFSLNLHCCYKK